MVSSGRVCEEGDISVGMEAVSDAGAGGDAGPEAVGPDGNTSVGADFDKVA